MSERAEPFWDWPSWSHLRFTAGVSVAGALWFALIYGGADAITAHRTFRVRVDFAAEQRIPFVPEAVAVYMSIYLLFAAAPFVLRQRREILRLAATLNLVILVAGAGFLLCPAQLAFPPPADLGAFPGLFRFADRLNLTYNLLPSLHVALSAACVAAFASHARRMGRTLLWSWALAVAVSTILTRQHHVADAVSGFALGLAGFRWIYWPRCVHRPQPEVNVDEAV